jgi:hypothetical protein
MNGTGSGGSWFLTAEGVFHAIGGVCQIVGTALMGVTTYGAAVAAAAGNPPPTTTLGWWAFGLGVAGTALTYLSAQKAWQPDQQK